MTPARIVAERAALAERERIIWIIKTEAKRKQSALATQALIDLLHLINDRNVL
jgi:hypothetical protein